MRANLNLDLDLDLDFLDPVLGKVRCDCSEFRILSSWAEAVIIFVRSEIFESSALNFGIRFHRRLIDLDYALIFQPALK